MLWGGGGGGGGTQNRTWVEEGGALVIDPTRFGNNVRACVCVFSLSTLIILNQLLLMK